MSEFPPSLRQIRLARERGYRRALALGAAVAIAGHAALFITLAPLQNRIPLVRQLGYEGPLRLLAEISVIREPGPVETDLRSSSGRGSRATFEAIDIAIVERERPAGTRTRKESGTLDESVGDEDLNQLERTLPQPTSRELVILRFVKPEYPMPSVRAGVEGVVTFRVHVTSDGTVARAWLLSSEVDRACDESARRALLQWRFRPFLSEGEPTDVLVDQRIRFTLKDALAAPGTAGDARAANGSGAARGVSGAP